MSKNKSNTHKPISADYSQPSLVNRSGSQGRILLEYIDWKESYFYKQVILRHVNDDQKWESNLLISDDEAEFLLRLIK